MPLINWKVELEFKWSMYCVLSAAGDDNANDNDDNIIFTIEDRKLYVPVVTLSVRNIQKLTQKFSKGFERSIYRNEYKTKSENKNRTDKYTRFLEFCFRFNILFMFQI